MVPRLISVCCSRVCKATFLCDVVLKDKDKDNHKQNSFKRIYIYNIYNMYMPAGIINKQKNRTHNAYEAILVIQNSHNLSDMDNQKMGA